MKTKSLPCVRGKETSKAGGENPTENAMVERRWQTHHWERELTGAQAEMELWLKTTPRIVAWNVGWRKNNHPSGTGETEQETGGPRIHYP